VLTALAVASLNAHIAGATSKKPPKRRLAPSIVAGTVLYETRGCWKRKIGFVPLTDARLVVTPAKGKAVSVLLGAGGRFRAKLAARGPFTGEIVLDGPGIAVGPDIAGTGPYHIELGTLARGKPFTTNRVKLDSPGDAGAANIWMMLNGAATFAADAAAPKRIPKVRAGWRYSANLTKWLGDHTPSQYDSARKWIHIGGRGGGQFRDEWTRFPVLHEYAHHVLDTIADPGPAATGEHSFRSAHPDAPALPWSEGFANAFAALAPNDPKLTLGCEVVMDLSPAPPKSGDNSTGGQLRDYPDLTASPDVWLPQSLLGQFNETAAAAAVWKVAGVLGRGKGPQGGFRGLLTALGSFHVRYGGPRDMREVADAILDSGLASDGAGRAAVLTGFAEAGYYAWGLSARVIADMGDDAICINGYDPAHPENGGCETRTVLEVRGPGAYGSCRSRALEDAGESTVRVGGGLPDELVDDCVIDFNSAEIEFPYLPGQAHRRGAYLVVIHLNCTSHIVIDPNDGSVAEGRCPSTWKVKVRVRPGENSLLILGEREITVPVNSSTTVVEMEAKDAMWSRCVIGGATSCLGPGR
jgi:hypothetical protein